MKNLYYITIISSLIFFSASVASAKKFKIISLDNFETIERIKFQDGSTSRHIILKKYYPNLEYKVPGHDIIHFYGINPETGVSSRKPILRISFENQKEDSIVFLKKDKTNPKNINYNFLENGPITFPMLSTMILNHSDKQVIAKIGSEIIKIEPNSQKLVILPKNHEGSFTKKVVFATRKKDQSIDYFYSSYWRVRSGHKTLCIIDYKEESETHKLTQILL